MSDIKTNEFTDIDNYHAKLIEIDNADFILVTNNTTLFSFFFPMPEYGLTNIQNFEYFLSQSIFKILRLSDFTQDEFEKVLDSMEHFNYSKSSNRSVMSSINNMGLFLENWVCDNLEILEINRRLNKLFFSKNDYETGVLLFKALLQK